MGDSTISEGRRERVREFLVKAKLNVTSARGPLELMALRRASLWSTGDHCFIISGPRNILGRFV